MVKMVVCICPKSEDYDETIVSVASPKIVSRAVTHSAAVLVTAGIEALLYISPSN